MVAGPPDREKNKRPAIRPLVLPPTYHVVHSIYFSLKTKGFNYYSSVREKLHVDDNPVLVSFLERTYGTFRDEITQQSSLVRDAIY